jgi:hypothetical protein
MDLLQDEDAPRVGRVPEDGRVLVVPGEDARPVREEEALGAEVAADGEEPVLRLLRVGRRRPRR